MSDAASKPESRRLFNISLWTAQGVLAVFYALVGFMKASQPIEALIASFIWPKLFLLYLFA